jgi:hypothetical protein
MLKKINCIFTPEGIFDLSHPQFDTVGAKSDESGVEGKKKKKFRAVTPERTQLF